MRLFLLGATGNSGRRILRFALGRGHQVTAFARYQNKLLEMLGRNLPKGLQVVVADIDKSAELTEAMVGANKRASAVRRSMAGATARLHASFAQGRLGIRL